MSAGPHTRDTAEEVETNKDGDLIRSWNGQRWYMECGFRIGVKGGNWHYGHYDDGCGTGEEVRPTQIRCSVRCPLLQIHDSVVELRCCPGATYALAETKGLK